MSQEKFWVLLSKKLSGEASSDEKTELERLILENPEWQYAIQNIEILWDKKPGYDISLSEDAFMLHMNRISELETAESDTHSSPVIRAFSNKKWRWMAAAASIILIVGIYSSGILFNQQSTVAAVAKMELNEVSTRKGSKTKIQLPDGSVVWLNAGSKLTYNKEYGLQLREVTLTGEGYFDIMKMKEKPFIIHTSNINIKVLGTAFNVKAYPEDKQTETSLIRGSIEVTIKNRPDNKIILSPNEKLIVENETLRAGISEISKGLMPAISINRLKHDKKDSSIAETQWVDNKLVFRDEAFEELVARMERWYDVEIVLQDSSLKQTRMNGSFDKETIDQALEALKLMIPFKIEQKGNIIIIHR